MTSTKRAYIGIDVGTTAIKALLVGDDGSVLADADAFLSINTPRPGWSEQRPEDWWDGTIKALTDVMNQASRLPYSVEVASIGLSGQMHSSVFLDASNNVIRPALLWNDVRTTSQCQSIYESVGMDGLHSTVANLALEGFTAPKLLWLRENEPNNFARLAKLLLPKDYIRFRLTGQFAIEPSDAAGTLLFDVRQRKWSSEILSKLDIPQSILPRVVESTEVSGHVTAEAATLTGLPTGVPVVGGGADNAAGAVSSGVVNAGQVQSSIGTSGSMLTPITRPQVDEGMRLHTFCHCAPDLWYLMGTVLSAGSALRWLRDVLVTDANESSYDSLTYGAENVSAGSDGLIFLPYLSGERTPHNDANARGVFFGLHMGHTRNHMVRSVMEGVCFALRDSLELMRSMAVSFNEVRAIGGGARSKLWCQIQADVFGVPVATMQGSGGPAFGAAMMGAVGTGAFDSISQAAESWVRIENITEPTQSNTSAYDDMYAQYQKLYPALKNRFAESAS